MSRVRLTTQTTPSTPPSGTVELFVDSDDKLVKQIDEDGTVLPAGGGSTPGAVRTLKFTVPFDTPWLCSPGGVALFTPAVGTQLVNRLVVPTEAFDVTVTPVFGTFQDAGTFWQSDSPSQQSAGLKQIIDGRVAGDQSTPPLDLLGVSAGVDVGYELASLTAYDGGYTWRNIVMNAVPLCVRLDQNENGTPLSTPPTSGSLDIYIDIVEPVATDLPPGPVALASPLDLNGELDANGDPIAVLLWLDASDEDTIHEADNLGFVSQWDDKSGEDKHATQPIVTQNQIYTVDITGASSGTWQLSVNGDVTNFVDWNISANDLRDELIAMTEAGIGDVTVGLIGQVYTIEFVGAMAGVPVSMTRNQHSLDVDPILTETQRGQSPQPATGAEQINGLNVLTFDGIDDAMDVLGFTLAQPFTTFGVSARGDDGDDSGTAGPDLFMDGSGNVSQSLDFASGTWIWSSVPGFPGLPRAASPDVTMSLWDEDRSFGRSNRTASTTADNSGNDITDPLHIGRDSADLVFANEGRIGNRWGGPIGELAVFAGVLTETQQRSLTEYAIAKWDL